MSGNADAEAKIIDAIYRGACDSAELSRALELIAGYFDSPGVLLGELDQARPERQFVMGTRTIDDSFFTGYARCENLDPAPRAYAALPVGRASLTDRMFSESFRRRNVFLNELLRPHGVKASLGSPLLASGGRSAMIGIFQSANRRSYDDDDIARLERLTPHLTRALQIRRLFLQSEARGKALESIVDRNETGMIGLRGDGPALFVNGAARAVAAARDGIGLDRERTAGGCRSCGSDAAGRACGRCRARRCGRPRSDSAAVGAPALCRAGLPAPVRRRPVSEFPWRRPVCHSRPGPPENTDRAADRRAAAHSSSEPPRWCRQSLKA